MIAFPSQYAAWEPLLGLIKSMQLSWIPCTRGSKSVPVPDVQTVGVEAMNWPNIWYQICVPSNYRQDDVACSRKMHLNNHTGISLLKTNSVLQLLSVISKSYKCRDIWRGCVGHSERGSISEGIFAINTHRNFEKKIMSSFVMTIVPANDPAPLDATTSAATVMTINSGLPLDKMAIISQTKFSYAFSRTKSFVFWLTFH